MVDLVVLGRSGDCGGPAGPGWPDVIRVIGYLAVLRPGRREFFYDGK
ncbi:hypothetical protein ACFQZ8_11770 [Micromonospora azadirachtae]|uniref:Uncharacterized protein n=1 Tax=Micromonospora azadirachtae TaxID=1970735 RepID=A0ABW3A116_9ACTN